MNDAAAINTEQHELWNAQTTDYWVGQKSALDKLLQPLTDLLLEAANLSGFERVADIGCGTGATTLSIASALDGRGHVIGIDISKKLIRTAISVAEKAGIKNVSFIEADAARFEFDKAQDLLISRCGVMFFGDLAKAFSHLRDGLQPDGRLLLAVWCAPEENEWYQFPMQCVEAFTGIHQPPDYDAPGAFTLAKESRVRDLLNTAGFTDIDLVAHQPNLFVGGTVSEAAELFMAMNSIRRLLREADDTLEHRVLQHMLEGLKDYQQDAGVYMKSACWLISAKPQS